MNDIADFIQYIVWLVSIWLGNSSTDQETRHRAGGGRTEDVTIFFQTDKDVLGSKRASTNSETKSTGLD